MTEQRVVGYEEYREGCKRVRVELREMGVKWDRIYSERYETGEGWKYKFYWMRGYALESKVMEAARGEFEGVANVRVKRTGTGDISILYKGHTPPMSNLASELIAQYCPICGNEISYDNQWEEWMDENGVERAERDEVGPGGTFTRQMDGECDKCGAFVGLTMTRSI
jgi:hypothetical protein